jgi:hypothetical protein
MNFEIQAQKEENLNAKIDLPCETRHQRISTA